MSDLTVEEEELLSLLIKKRESKEASIEVDGKNVLKLIPGGKPEPTVPLRNLMENVKLVEDGKIVDFVFVGIVKDSTTANITYSATPPSFQIMGAVEALKMLWSKMLVR